MTRPGRLCVDTGHRHPDNNLVDVEKTFERDEEEEVEEEEGRRPDYMPVRGLWPGGTVVKCWIRRSVRPAADYGHISRDSV